jgi:hypothetical protein
MHVNGQEATRCERCSHPQGAWATYIPTDEWEAHVQWHKETDAKEKEA